MQARNGDTVKVHYTARLENERVISTTKGRPPLEIRIGSGKCILGLEQGIVGMAIGETRTITVLPEKAFGPKWEELMVEVDKSELPDSVTPTVGKRLQVRKEGGGLVDVTIAAINEDTVTLDANHPLAGEMLTFDIELVALT
jgi:peptidylprolyl isomerase